MRQWLLLTAIAGVYAATQVGVIHRGDGRYFALADALATRLSLNVAPMARALGEAPPPGGVLRAGVPPGAAIATVPFRWAGLAAGNAGATGSFADLGAQITVLAAACAMASCVLLIYFACLEMGCRPKAAGYAAAAFGATTLAFPYGGRLAEPAFAAWTVVAFYYGYLRLRAGWDTPPQQLLLGASLMAAPLVSDLTLLCWPLFLFLMLIQIKYLFRTKTAAPLVIVPAFIGVILYAAHNTVTIGDPFVTAGGTLHISKLYDAYTSRKFTDGLLVLFFFPLDVLNALAAAVAPPSKLFAAPAAGLLLASPHLLFALLGIFQLRSEGLTRRPLYALLAIVALWGFLAAGSEKPLLGLDRDASVLLPVVALSFILIGSFIDYHLMSMRAVILKPLLLVGFGWLAALSFHNAIAVVMNRTLTAPAAQVLFFSARRAADAASGDDRYQGYCGVALPDGR
ncbi:MAG: hypothetical protein M5R36_15610 [Deltaproteobacteria bacterium]|nr:hypothetical protein [Deltaproteobacteria bacterium]